MAVESSLGEVAIETNLKQFLCPFACLRSWVCCSPLQEPPLGYTNWQDYR
jgi:hypothetical protein